jgi:hypothetical protein
MAVLLRLLFVILDIFLCPYEGRHRSLGTDPLQPTSTPSAPDSLPEYEEEPLRRIPAFPRVDGYIDIPRTAWAHITDDWLTPVPPVATIPRAVRRNLITGELGYYQNPQLAILDGLRAAVPIRGHAIFA